MIIAVPALAASLTLLGSVGPNALEHGALYLRLRQSMNLLLDRGGEPYRGIFARRPVAILRPG